MGKKFNLRKFGVHSEMTTKHMYRYIPLNLKTFISFSEFMSAKPPCRACIVRATCSQRGERYIYAHKAWVPIILFSQPCTDLHNYLKRFDIYLSFDFETNIKWRNHKQ